LGPTGPFVVEADQFEKVLGAGFDALDVTAVA
jgi:hypothetical protein